MPTTLFLEAFGQLYSPATIDSSEEDLYSFFRERAELMRWATTSKDRLLLWSLEEAEITADTDPRRIGAYWGALLIDSPEHQEVAMTEFSITEAASVPFPMVRHAAEVG